MVVFIIIGTLVAIIYEDFRFRAIHWYWLVILSISSYFYSNTPSIDILANFCFIFHSTVFIF